MSHIASIPMRSIGPIHIEGPTISDQIKVPLATYETPVWPSTNRGAKVSRLIGGIKSVLLKDAMTRSIAIEAIDVVSALEAVNSIQSRTKEIEEVVHTSSRFAKLESIVPKLVGRIIYLRLAFTTGDASGHNMVTKASEYIQNWILESYPNLKYVSLSGNFCTDKKTSSVNSLLGRGKSVICEGVISKEICQDVLKTTPEKLVELHIKKNLLGSIAAGSLHSANAHFANVLLAFYLATGQDAANIVEGSQGIVHAECEGDDLYFSITAPNIIVGTVGNGKGLPFVEENLKALGCMEQRAPGDNAKRLAVICAATIWCCELSLLAALTNPGELMRAHTTFERKTGAKT